MGRNPGGEKQKLRKGLWSPEEDEKLFKHINTYGVGCWSSVAKQAGLQRCGKSCRLRWINYLRPGIKRGSFSEEEENLVISLHKILGNRWSQIASHLPRRTDNEIKNLWNSTIKKKLAKTQGLADSNLPRPLGSYSKSVVNPTDTDTGSSSVQGGNVSCSTSTAAAAGGGNVAVSGGGENCFSKSGMEDFLQLIHNNCTGIDQEQDLASMMSGEGLDREYEVGFF